MGNVDLERAVASLDMRLDQYIKVVLAPLAVVSVLAALALSLLMPGLFSGALAPLPWVLPAFAIGVAVFYPMSLADKRGTRMDHNMHYFITHLGTLATAKVPPVELFEKIGDKQDEYGPLAEECEKVAMLVMDWNMSLSDACRFVAKRSPSVLYSDFLERFAFAIESGTEVQSFLKNEQEVVMADYETLYEATIKNVEDLKELFNGAMMMVIFSVMFALLMAILIDVTATMVLSVIVVLTLLMQAAFLMLVKQKIPPDPVWSNHSLSSPVWSQLKIVLPACLALSIAVGVIVFLYTDLNVLLGIALTAAPLFVPGWMAGHEEQDVKRRDDNYPAFVRSLGSSSAARGGDERGVLKHLRHHDFGPLSTNIRDLFTRLQLRADDELAWDFFTTETGSHLVERFTHMYDEAVDAGGRSDEIGRIISENMVRIVGLRKLRYQAAGTFRGMLYGIAAGAAFALFVGLGVLDMLTGLFSGLDQLDNAPVSVPSILHVDDIVLPLLQGLAIVILLGNAFMSAVLVRLVDGGTPLRGFKDFTVLVWISHVVAFGSQRLLSSFLGTSMGV